MATETIERVTAWQCIGCGRVEGPQPCVGICEDRRTEFVYAADYDTAIAQLAAARERTAALAALVRQIANTTPRKGACERTWKALQARARATLEALAAGTESRPV